MGRGNWFPGNDSRETALVYVDYSDDSEDPDHEEWKYEGFKNVVKSCLPKSFTMADQYDYRRFRSIDRDSAPIAYNGLFVLWIDTQGESRHQGIGFTVREDAPAFAKSQLHPVSKSFFDKLSGIYRLRVRSCAWTSSPYVVEQKKVTSTT